MAKTMTGAPGFGLVVDFEDGDPTVALRGEADGAVADQLWECLAGVSERASRVTVDLAATSFLDSSILSVLVRAQNGLRAGGGGLSVTGAHPRLYRLFEITGLTHFLAVRP